MIEFQGVPTFLEDIGNRRCFVCWGWREKNGKQTKPPLKPNGQLASTNNPKTWRTLDTVLKAAESHDIDGVGLVLTEDREHIAFDLDHCRDPETGTLELWARDLLARLNTYTELTPSGAGARAIGTVPPGWREKVHESITMGDNGAKVEIFYHYPRYITITGALVPGAPEELADVSAVADEFITDDEIRNIVEFDSHEDAGAPSLNELVDTVWQISPEVERADWIKVGHAVKAAGEVWPKEAEKLWLDWSFSSRTYEEGNKAGAAQEAWDSFKPMRCGYGTLVYMAEQFPAELDAEPIDTEAIFPLAKPAAPDLSSILNPPGLVGDLAEYTNQVARRETPLLNILAGLASVSLISSNSFVVQLPGGLTPLNLYLMGIAPTGAGKEVLRSTCSYAAYVAGMEESVLDYVASDAGLHRMLGDEHAAVPTLWQCDEAGRYLKSAANTKMGGHQYAVITYAMRLYGLALSRATARPRADKKESLPPVPCPYLCTLLTTTPRELHTALSSTEVVNGMLSRFVTLQISAAPLKPRDRKPAPTCFPEALTSGIEALKAAADDAWVRRESRPQIQRIGRWFTTLVPEPSATAVLEDFEYEADELGRQSGIPELWTRTFENAVRIAGVVAIGDQTDFTTPTLTEAHARYGIALARHAAEAMARMVKAHVADSDFERECNKLLEKIKGVLETPPAASTNADLAANNEGIVTRSQIHMVCRWLSRKERDNCIEGLIDRGDLSVNPSTDKGQGRRPERFKVRR